MRKLTKRPKRPDRVMPVVQVMELLEKGSETIIMPIEPKSDIQIGPIKEILKNLLKMNNDLYGIFIDKIGCGPLDGGCYVMAKALQETIGGELYTLYGQSKNGPYQAQHIMLKKDGVFWDAEGFLPDEKILQRWEDQEGLMGVVLHSFEEGDCIEASRDKDLIKKVAEHLAQAWTLPENWVNFKDLDYERWYDDNEQKLLIECAESGTDRELDFDYEQFCEDRFGLFEDIQSNLIAANIFPGDNLVYVSPENGTAYRGELQLDNNGLPFVRVLYGDTFDVSFWMNKRESWHTGWQKDIQSDLMTDLDFIKAVQHSSTPGIKAFENEAINKWLFLLENRQDNVIPSRELADLIKRSHGLENKEIKLAYNAIIRAEKFISIKRDGSMIIIGSGKPQSWKYSMEHSLKEGDDFLIRDRSGKIVEQGYSHNEAEQRVADLHDRGLVALLYPEPLNFELKTYQLGDGSWMVVHKESLASDKEWHGATEKEAVLAFKESRLVDDLENTEAIGLK